MVRLAAKSLWARKLRALLTTLAVVSGVAFVAGTYILTDTTFRAFDEIFADSLAKTDVVITAREEVVQESGETPSFSEDVLPKVKGVDGVAEAVGSIFTVGAFFDAENEEIGQPFAPKFITSVLPPTLETQTYEEGRPPRTRSEASLDASAAEKAGIGVGDELKLVAVEKVTGYRVVGLTKLGEASFGGASIAGLVFDEAQRITDKRGELDQILIRARPGVSEDELKRRVERVTPPTVRVETATENAARNSDQIRDQLGFLRIILLVFAFVALFVGAFLIFNTFSITVAQRVTEFGMLRTLGAGRGQLLTAVISEALLIGIAGSLLGIAAGYALAVAINALFVAVGIDLPSTSLVTEPRTVIVSFLIGTGVTLISALVPALRATRVPPIAALRALELPESRRRRVAYLVLAALLALLGLALLVAGLFGDSDGGTAAGMVGGGAFAFVLAVSLFSPRLVRPMAAVIGRPLELARRLIGRLARENTQRNPSRTAVTAAALMIGLAVVTFVTVFAAGLKSSVSTAIGDTVRGEIVIQHSDGFSPISPRIAKAAEGVEGVKSVATVRSAQAEIVASGDTKFLSALSPNGAEAVNIDWIEGGPQTLAGLRDDQVILNESVAEAEGLEVGDEIRFLTQIGARPQLEIVGEFKDKAELIGSAIVTQELFARDFGQTDDSIDFVTLDAGADAVAVQKRLERLMERDYPVAEVRNEKELKEYQEEQIDQLLGLIYVLLLLAVVISLFGIANTLALSIHERTRELGMLRAIGMSRRQVRTMIRYEAVITALIGAVLGLALGVLFAALMAQPLADEGFTLSYPIPTLIVLLVVAALAGVLAAIAPARRASRLDPLEALQYE